MKFGRRAGADLDSRPNPLHHSNTGDQIVRVGDADVNAAGAPVWLVYGPVDPNAGSHAGEVLDRMASLGPRFRVGLQPSRDTTRWNFNPWPGRVATSSRDLTGCVSPQEILDRVVGGPPEAPISVGQAGEFLAVCIDHGVGDSHVIMEIGAAISRAEMPSGFVDPVPDPTIDKPVKWATVHYLRAAPGQFLRHAIELVAGARGTSGAGSSGADSLTPHDAPEPPPDAGSCAVFVRSAPDFVDELRRWRDSAGLQASLSSLLILTIYRALQEAGIRLTDECGVLVDLRRFLPAEARTLANFFALTSVPTRNGIGYEEFGAALRTKAASKGALVRLVASLAAARAQAVVKGGRRPAEAAAGESRESAVHLTISDVSRVPSIEKFGWTRRNDAEFAVLLPPGSPSHVSIGLWKGYDGSIQLTASFSAACIDKQTMRNALQNALTSANLPAMDQGADAGHGVA